MRANRMPVLVFVLVSLVAAVLLVRSDDGTSADPSSAVDVRSLAPTAAPADALSSTWYCAAGSAGDITLGQAAEGDPDVDADGEDDADADPDADGDAGTEDGADPEDSTDPEAEPTGPVLAEHTVSIANLGSTDRTATVAVHAGTAEPVVIEVEVPALSTERVELADHAQGSAVAALVEVDGGDVVVSHRLVGETGIDSGPCASSSSDVWYFAWGDTARDVKEVIAIFNPFPGDAVVDLRFDTEDGVREPQALTGLVVPGQSVIVADVSAEVPRRDQVAATVSARSGRIVAERIQVADGTEREDDLPAREGLAVDLGSRVADEIWVHPDGDLSESRRQRVVVYNPSDDPAEVDVEIGLGTDVVGGVEPFELSVRPHSAAFVDLDGEERLADVFGEDDGRFSITVRSVNGVPVAAEIVDTTGEPGWAASTGGNVVGTATVFVEPRPEGPTGQVLSLLSLDATASTTVTLETVDDGEIEIVEEIVLEPGERLDVRPGDEFDDVGAMIVRSSIPVASELVTRWSEPWGLSVRSGVPLADGAARVVDLIG